jgi:hypothetical protein
MVMAPPVVSKFAPPLRTLTRVRLGIAMGAIDLSVPPSKLKMLLVPELVGEAPR